MGCFPIRRKIGVILLWLFLAPVLLAQTEDTVLALGGATSQGIRSQSPIHIPPCASPRETIDSFNQLTAGVKTVFEGGSFYGDVDWEKEQQLIALFEKLAYLLDTSALAENDRYANVNIIISQLAEILNRIDLPALEDIPDHLPSETLFWRIPGTVLALERITSGPRANDWVFSGQTVADAGRLYSRIKSQPYRTDAQVGEINDQGGILDHYIAYTGPLIPVDFTNHIPSFLRKSFLGDPLWKYFATLAILLTLLAAGVLVRYATRYRRDRLDSPNDVVLQVRRIFLPLVMLVLFHLAIDLITIDVRLRLLPLQITDDILWACFYLTTFWLFVCIANLISAIIITLPHISPFGLDASLVRLGCRLVAYLIGLWILIAGMQRLGLSLVPLIAGVSVGGLAFALAARPTLGNILSGILIFADRPFRVGERVVIDKHDGVVEEIGLRSTRIRTLDGHLLTVPNEEVSNNFIENVGQRPHIKRVLNVTLTYDTPPDKIREAIAILRQLLSTEEDGGKPADELGRPPNSQINYPDFPPRVYFNDLNADSLNILVIYWYFPPVFFDYLEHCTWFNTELIERYNQAGIDFAFPTQTIELKQSAAPAIQGEPSDRVL